MSREIFFAFVFVFLAASIYAQEFTGTTGGEFSYGGGSYVFSSPQYNQPSFSSYYSGENAYDYWGSAEEYRENCYERKDFLIQVAPGGCTPAVVRSDLLAEQNVPVFCKLQALQINPLIEPSSIRNMRFVSSGKLPQEVEGVSYKYHNPALALSTGALSSRGFGTLDNAGYLVVILKKHPDERTLPENITGILTAQIFYDAVGGIGLGMHEKVVPVMNDANWKKNYVEYGFIDGKGFLRVEQIQKDRAKISVYRDVDTKLDSFIVEKGKTSAEKYLPGFYCNAAYKVSLVDAVVPETKAVISFDEEEYDVYRGGRFADGLCVANNIEPAGYNAGKISLRCSGVSENIELELKSLEEGETRSEDKEGTKEFEKYFGSTIDAYYDIEHSYGQIDKTNINPPQKYGKYALERAGKFAEEVGKSAKNFEIQEMLIEKYQFDDGTLERLKNYESSGAVYNFEADGAYHVIRLKSIQEPDDKDLDLGIYVDGQYKSGLKKKGEYLVSPEEARETNQEKSKSIQLVDFDDSCIFVQGCEGKKEICIGERKDVCGHDVYVKNIMIKYNARIRLEPVNKRIGSEVNFSYGIGIEKRAFPLTPEKAIERIAKLNESIKKWQDINEKLGKTVKAMKAACFATSAALQVKNLFTGMGGKAIARQQVMQGDNGWNALCAEAMGNNGIPKKSFMKQGKYSSIEDCLRKNNEIIETQVKTVTDSIKTVNDEIKEHEKDYMVSGSGLFSGKQVNVGEASKAMLEEMKRENINIEVVNSEGKKLKISDVLKLIGADGNYDYSDLTDINLYTSILQGQSDNGLKKIYQEKLYDKLAMLQEANEQKARENSVASAFEGNVAGHIEFVSSSRETKQVVLMPNLVATSINNVDNGKQIAFISYQGSSYLADLRDKDGQNYEIEKIFKIEGNTVGAELECGEGGSDKSLCGSIKSAFPNFKIADAGYYSNRYENAEVRFYETEPYKGMPALVPFDLANGWYVATRQTLPVFGELKTFQDSGMVNSFWIGNVGKNRREEFSSGIGDDEVRQFNLNTGQPIGEFPGLSEEKTKQLVAKAISALNEAARQRKSRQGLKEITINGKKIKIGNPAVDVSQSQCTDFMSPKDCQLLFNVCDPVICPSSRCDFGGKYPVEDVVQSGIIGSLVLCLPNFKEGIYVPICLTGVHAGIDNWVSIMEAHKKCLEQNLESGEYVGICDEISAIYKCEFFWKQFAPLMNVIVPKMLGFFSGGARGGGEYMGISAAWENMQNSISYFKNVYAVNALTAFRVRSTAEVGTQVCKSFISVVYPNKFKTLIEPDSPTQFSAWFEEIKMSDATIPAFSHYKVYYHIYAGNDQGVYYSVYLMNEQDSSYYYGTGGRGVATGFISKGEYVDEAKDFLAPAGLKTLCVRINGKDECGFKQVSTSFALNYVKDKYAQSQIENKNIKTEKACISGTPNALALVNPNIQAGAEDIINPADYERGIIRVCATSNPGATTNPARWVEVGVCGDDDIKCWLDSDSVENAIKYSGIQDATQDELNNLVKEQQQKESGAILDREGFKKKLDGIKAEINNFRDYSGDYDDLSAMESTSKVMLAEIDGLRNEFVLFEQDEAEVLLLEAEVYEVLAKRVYILTEKTNINDNNCNSLGGTWFMSYSNCNDANGDKENYKSTDLTSQATDKDINPDSVCCKFEEISEIKSLKCNEMKDNIQLSIKFNNCISEEKINSLLEVSPAKSTGNIFYDLGEKYDIDPIIALAFFNQESSFGKEGIARITKSIGNIKYSLNCPGSDYEGFCQYNSWEQSIDSWYKLINTNTYVGSGLDTVEKIVPKYAPESDNNNPEEYIQSVRSFVKKYREVSA